MCGSQMFFSDNGFNNATCIHTETRLWKGPYVKNVVLYWYPGLQQLSDREVSFLLHLQQNTQAF